MAKRVAEVAKVEAVKAAEAEAEAEAMVVDAAEEDEEAWRRAAFGSCAPLGTDEVSDQALPEAAQEEMEVVAAEASLIAAAPGAVATAADRYLVVLREFVTEAEAQLTLVGDAEASFAAEAAACAAFFGETASVSAALALLKQLDTFITGLHAAHETNLKAEAATQRKRQMAERQTERQTERQLTTKPQPPSPSPGGGTPKRSAVRAITARGTPKFEECASALQSILEGGGENGGAPCAPAAGTKLRRLASSEQQRGAKENAQTAQAAELQALFLRRQSGMGITAGHKRPV